jgi:hypothetical protein
MVWSPADSLSWLSGTSVVFPDASLITSLAPASIELDEAIQEVLPQGFLSEFCHWHL